MIGETSMKHCSKTLASILLGVMVMNITSCYREQPMPYGVWQSENPSLILDINFDIAVDGFFYPGKYSFDGKIIEIYAGFDMVKGGTLTVYDKEAIETEKTWGSDEYRYFDGWVTINGNSMIFKLREKWQEKTGYKEILFEKIGDYSPPSSLSPIVADMVKKPNGAI